MKKKRDYRRRRVDAEVMEMTRDRRRRQAKIERSEKRRRAAGRRRRAMLLLWMTFAALVVVLVMLHKKSREGVEGASSSITEDAKGRISVGGAGENLTATAQPQPEALRVAESTGMSSVSADFYPGGYEGAVDISGILSSQSALDVMSGQAAVDLTLIEGGEYKKVAAAKAAMAQRSYFTGTVRTVNDYLSAYGEGSWHAVRDVSGEVCAFYEGVHNEEQTVAYAGEGESLSKEVGVPFKVVFTVYEDGSFAVTEVTEGGAPVDDVSGWLRARVGQ